MLLTTCDDDLSCQKAEDEMNNGTPQSGRFPTSLGQLSNLRIQVPNGLEVTYVTLFFAIKQPKKTLSLILARHILLCQQYP